METTLTQEVLDFVRRWAAAELAGDGDAFDALLADDFVGVGPVGFVLDRAQWAERHRGDLTNEEFEILDPHVRRYGDVVLVEAVQRQRTYARGHDASGSFRVLLALVRSGDAWTIAHIQLSGPLIKPGEKPPFAR